jgi:hypothetical protein
MNRGGIGGRGGLAREEQAENLHIGISFFFIFRVVVIYIV